MFEKFDVKNEKMVSNGDCYSSDSFENKMNEEENYLQEEYTEDEENNEAEGYGNDNEKTAEMKVELISGRKFSKKSNQSSSDKVKLNKPRRIANKTLSYSDMIVESVGSLGSGRKGVSSILLRKDLVQKLVGQNRAFQRYSFIIALKSCIESGLIIQLSGVGASGSFKIPKILHSTKKTVFANKTTLTKKKNSRKTVSEKEHITAKVKAVKSAALKRPLNSRNSSIESEGSQSESESKKERKKPMTAKAKAVKSAASKRPLNSRNSSIESEGSQSESESKKERKKPLVKAKAVKSVAPKNPLKSRNSSEDLEASQSESESEMQSKKQNSKNAIVQNTSAKGKKRQASKSSQESEMSQSDGETVQVSKKRATSKSPAGNATRKRGANTTKPEEALKSVPRPSKSTSASRTAATKPLPVKSAAKKSIAKKPARAK